MLNGSVANLGKVDAVIQSHQLIPDLTKATSSNKKFSLNRLQEATEDLPVLFKAIYGISKVVAEVRRLTGWDQVFDGGSIAKKIFLGKAKEFQQFKKDSGVSSTPDAVLRRGLFAHLIQHTGGSEFEINSQFSDNKSLVEQTIAAYRQKKSTANLADRLEEIYHSEIEPHDTLNGFIDAFTQAHANDVHAVDFFKNAFAKIKDNLAFVTEAYQNERFDGNINNYTPRSYTLVDRHPVGESTELGIRSSNSTVGVPAQSPTSISRLVERKLPQGAALDFNFDYTMTDKYRRAVYDIKTVQGRYLFSEFMKRKESGDIMGGLDNKARIRNQYKKAEQAQAGYQHENDVAGEILQDTFDTLKNLGTIFALGGVLQYPKQYISVALKTILMLGKDAALMFKVQGVNLKELPLLQQTSIIMRGEHAGGYVRGGREEAMESRAVSDSLTRSTTKWMKEKSESVRNIFLKSLSEGDTRVAQRSFLAYYMRYLKDNGVSITAKELPTEHERFADPVRQKALAYAQQMIDETQVVTNQALLADVKRRDGNTWKEAVKSVLFPFNTFSSNTRARMVEDVKLTLYGDTVQKKEALLDFGSNVAEIAAYQALNTVVLTAMVKYPLHELLDWLFDLDESDQKTFGDRMDFEFKKFYSNSVKDVAFSGIGNTAELQMMKQLNNLGWLLHGMNNPEDAMTKTEWLQNAPLYVYDNPNPSTLSQLGSYGIWLDEVRQYPSDFKAALTGEARYHSNFSKETDGLDQVKLETTIVDKPAELSQDERSYMFFVSMMNVLALTGMRDADVARVINQKKQEVIKLRGSENRTIRAPRAKLLRSTNSM